MFQIKDFPSIVAGMINHARGVTTKITDWLPGSAARTIMEASAVEIEELYHQMFIGLREAIPVAVFQSFGFNKLPAAYARGFVSISSTTPLSSPITIPVGTVFSTQDGRKYKTLAQVVWASGSTMVSVSVQAEDVGAAYNCSPGTINSSSLFSAANYHVSCPAITTGRDVETDDERILRFRDYIQSLSSGTTVACLYSAKTSSLKDQLGNISEYVTKSGIIEIAGYIRIFIQGSGGAPSAQLIAEAQRNLDGWVDETGIPVPGVRSGGVRCEVEAMTAKPVNLSLGVKMLPGYTFTVATVQALRDRYDATLAAVQPGTVLHLGTISESLLDSPGVLEVVPNTTSNVICAPSEVLVPGNFSATELTA